MSVVASKDRSTIRHILPKVTQGKVPKFRKQRLPWTTMETHFDVDGGAKASKGKSRGVLIRYEVRSSPVNAPRHSASIHLTSLARNEWCRAWRDVSSLLHLARLAHSVGLDTCIFEEVCPFRTKHRIAPARTALAPGRTSCGV